GLQVREVAVDRGDGESATGLPVTHQAIPALDVAIDLDAIPLLGVADIVDRHVIVLAPEERYGVELFASAQHVQGRRLPLALGHHPLVGASGLTAVGIGPPREVAGGKDAGVAGP